jgi:ribose transport system permease protein
MKRSGQYFFIHRNIDTLFAYGIFIVLYILFAFHQADFFSAYGQRSIFNQVITLSIVAFAQMLVVLTGGIDLSVASLVALSNCLAAKIMQPMITMTGNEIIGIFVTILIVLIVSALCGTLNGILVVFGRIQAIIITLATSMIFFGIASYIMPVPGGIVPRSFVRFFSGFLPGTRIPATLLIILFLVFAVWIPFRRTRFCQAIYALGGNSYSAYASGINTKRINTIVYIVGGIMCGFAGIVFTAHTASGDALGSSGFTMNAIAAVVLGGVYLTGGRGSYVGVVAGSLVMSMTLGLLIFWKISSFYQGAAQGLILLVALSFGLLREMLRKRKANSTTDV